MSRAPFLVRHATPLLLAGILILLAIAFGLSGSLVLARIGIGQPGQH